MKQVHITTGDEDGIGLEVSLKALQQLPLSKGSHAQFVLWRKKKDKKECLLNNPLMDSIPLEVISCRSIEQLHNIEKTKNTLIDMACHLSPTQWVIQAGQYCLSDPLETALVTAPLSKKQIQKDGFSERGHTELLKNLSQTPSVFMVFLGDHFNTALLTGHCALKEVSWTERQLSDCLNKCQKLLSLISHSEKKPLAVLGLNPHAGEDGLLGREELKMHECLKKHPYPVIGPLVPDTAFFKKNWKQFSIYICLYHDQALIPFKMVHERKSFQLSLGLPFMRTSVSHGTAKDIFNQGIADPESTKRALLWAIQKDVIL